jgi:CxC6 like cysteine cluster associated with KDZ transposases
MALLYLDCISELANSRGAAFCPHHEHFHGAKCHVKNCNVQKIAGTQACEEHQEKWNRHVQCHQQQNVINSKHRLV